MLLVPGRGCGAGADLVVEVVPVELREQRDQRRRFLRVQCSPALVAVETGGPGGTVDALSAVTVQARPAQLDVETRRVAPEGTLHHFVEVAVQESFRGAVVVQQAVVLVGEYERLRVFTDQVVQAAYGFRDRHAVVGLAVPLAIPVDAGNVVDDQECAVQCGVRATHASTSLLDSMPEAVCGWNYMHR